MATSKTKLSAAVLGLVLAGAPASVILDQFLNEKEGNSLTAYKDGSGIWTLYERSAEGDWSEVDYGTLRANGDSQYEAVSDAYEDVSYDLYLADDNAMYWGGENDYYQRT